MYVAKRLKFCMVDMEDAMLAVDESCISEHHSPHFVLGQSVDLFT